MFSLGATRNEKARREMVQLLKMFDKRQSQCMNNIAQYRPSNEAKFGSQKMKITTKKEEIDSCIFQIECKAAPSNLYNNNPMTIIIGYLKNLQPNSRMDP